MYEIHPTMPRKFNYVGFWSDRGGFVISEDNKWIRRRNLQVKILIVIFLATVISNALTFQGLTFTAQGVDDGLFIKEMIPMAGSNTFGFSGPMEDVWTALQVEYYAMYQSTFHNAFSSLFLPILIKLRIMMLSK